MIDTVNSGTALTEDKSVARVLPSLGNRVAALSGAREGEAHLSEAKLKPELGLWRSTALVVGNIIGSGIFLLPASLGIYGSLGLVGWMVSGAGSICLALVFARLSRQFPRTGGPYAYSREAFGDFVGFQMAWSYWMGTWASNAAISTAFVSYMAAFYPELKTHPTYGFFLALSSVWFFTFLSTTSVRSAGSVQVVITIMKAIPLIAIGVVGMFYVDFSHFLIINPSGESTFKAIAASAALTLFAFLGLESATVPAENVVNPEKTIPRATILGTVFSAIVYVWTTIVLLGVIEPLTLSKSNAPFADAAGLIFGPWASPIIAGCAVLAAFGTMNGWILLQGHVPLAAARDGLFPAIFAKVSKSGTPYIGSIVSSLLMTCLLYMNYQANLVDQFTTIVNFTTFAVLLPYLYSAVADLYFLAKSPVKVSSFYWLRTSGIALLAFLYSLLIIAGAGKETVFLGVIFLFSGFPVYVWMKAKKTVKQRAS